MLQINVILLSVVIFIIAVLIEYLNIIISYYRGDFLVWLVKHNWVSNNLDYFTKIILNVLNFSVSLSLNTCVVLLLMHLIVDKLLLLIFNYVVLLPSSVKHQLNLCLRKFYLFFFFSVIVLFHICFQIHIVYSFKLSPF